MAERFTNIKPTEDPHIARVEVRLSKNQLASIVSAYSFATSFNGYFIGGDLIERCMEGLHAIESQEKLEKLKAECQAVLIKDMKIDMVSGLYVIEDGK